MPLRDLTIKDGDRVVFTVMWRGIPRPTINWYFNSEAITPSDDFQIKIDINRCESTLTIKEVFPDDEGEYMCKAESALGAAVTHCHLFVTLPTSSEEDIQKLVSQSEDIRITKESLHLKERSSFSETISIDTQKRFKEFQMQFQIPDQKAERSEIMMRQQAALRGMKMQVDVELPTPKTFAETKTMHLQKSIDVMSGMHSHKQTGISTKQLAYLKLPLQQQRRFSETIAIDQSKCRNEPVQVTFTLPEQRRRLEKSAIQIRQQASLRGMKMEVEIAEQKRQKTEVKHITKKHAQAISTQRQEFHMQLEGAPPHFTIDLTSAKVMDGEEIKFNATVVGNPMPEVTWYKNGKVIVENPDFHTTFDKKTGVCTLHILEVFPQDTGEYRCIAVNQYGRAVTGATLQVDVFEYVQDSEEASASAAESLPDRQVSEDEMEFLERTQAFIANMQKLRQELQEEQVREEEVVMTEEYHEETVQMAEVKWQIPKKGVTLEVQSVDETTQEVPEETIEVTHVDRVQVAMATSQVQQQPEMQVQHTDMIYQQEYVEDHPSPPPPEVPYEEEIVPDLKTSVKAPPPDVLVQPQVEHMAEELASEICTEVTTDMIDGQQVVVELAQHAIEHRKESMAIPLEEHLMPETVLEGQRVPSPEETMQMQVEVALEVHQVQQAEESMVTQLEEVTQPEVVNEDVRALSPAEPTQEQVTVELSQHELVQAKESLVQPQLEQVQPEIVEESIERIPTPEGAGEQQVVMEMGLQVKQQPKGALVAPTEEHMEPELVQEGQRMPTPEGAEMEDIYAEVNRAEAADAAGTMVMQSEQVVQPHETDEGEVRMPTPEEAGEEQVTVDMGKMTMQAARGNMVMPQVQELAPEVVTESTERIPTPEEAGQEQVKVTLAQNVVQAATGSWAMTQEERLTEETFQDILDRMPSPQGAEGQDIIVPLDRHDVAAAKQHFTGIVEERHTPEEEEDIFFEAQEPEVKGEEVTVELANVLVQHRSLVLTETQFAQIDVVTVGEANADYYEEDSFKEEVLVPLEQAKKQQAKPSLVCMQEQVVTPVQTEEMNLEPPVEESTQPLNVVVPMDTAARQAAKGSLVSKTEEVVDVQMTREDIEELHEETSHRENVHVQMESAYKMHRPLQLAGPVVEKVAPERPGSQYDDSIKEMRMIPTYVQPEYEPAVLEWFRLEIRVGPRAFDDQEITTDEQFAEESSLTQLQAQLQLDQQQLQQTIIQSTIQQQQYQTDMQQLEWHSEAAAESHAELHVQKTETRVEQQVSMMAASSSKQVIRAAQEVTEECEVITETTTEEIEVIRRPTVEDLIQPEPSGRVRAPPPHPNLAPVFEMMLSDVTVADGETALLECKVTGTPEPEVTWYIDEMEIKITTEIHIEYTIEGYCRLIISDVLPDDEGEYKVKAVNQAGTCVSTAYLTVLPPERSEPASPVTEMHSETVVSESFRKMEVDISMQTRKEMSIVEVPIPMQAEGPRIIRHLEHKEIFESMPVTLECHITGNPEPEISWYQDGKKLTSTEHMQIQHNKGVCRLQINKVTIQDEAEYMVEARNEYGLANTVCELLVESKRPLSRFTHAASQMAHPCVARCA